MDKDLRFTEEYYGVNQILAEWNPIEVPEAIAETEYTVYVQNLLKFRHDLPSVLKEMERLIVENMGLEYDATNPEQLCHIQFFANKIYSYLNQKGF